MDETKHFSEYLVDEYSLPLLNWAYKKLADREKAEELVQEIWLQFFTALRKNESDGISIQKAENFLWKIAHYVWCHYCRQTTSRKMTVPMDELSLADETDFAQELSDAEETKARISYMRKKIISLNRLQREIMISFYIDNQSQKQIAERLGITESALKWHLFSTRKKVKEEILSMENTNFVYRPRSLHMALSGASVPSPDINVIENSLTKQNICIACYREPKTLDELEECLGIPKTYIEFDLEWLVQKEFLIQSKSGYVTAFMIQTVQDEQAQCAVFCRHRETLSNTIINAFVESEQAIRAIGFYGCDQPLEKLLWLFIYRFCNYEKFPYPPFSYPIRPDGGRYYPLGFDRTDSGSCQKAVDTAGWGYNGTISDSHFSWLGLYNFSRSEIEEVISSFTPEAQLLHDTLCRLIDLDYDISTFDENQKYALSLLVQKGFVTVENHKAYPNFCVFTKEQYRELEQKVYEPLFQKTAKEITLLCDELVALAKEQLPPQLTSYENLFVCMALRDIAYFTTIFAFQNGKLYVPKDNHDGEFLTMMYLRQ